MIKKVRYNVFDVFFGDGWSNWVRMESPDGNTWGRIAGDTKLAKGAAILLQRRFSKKEYTNA